jgi:hypothetical protein
LHLSLQIYAKDAASADKLSSTLGTGSGALDKINSELQKQGLEKSTGLDVVSTTKSDNTGLIVGTKKISRSSNSQSHLFLFQQ